MAYIHLIRLGGDSASTDKLGLLSSGECVCMCVKRERGGAAGGGGLQEREEGGEIDR